VSVGAGVGVSVGTGVAVAAAVAVAVGSLVGMFTWATAVGPAGWPPPQAINANAVTTTDRIAAHLAHARLRPATCHLPPFASVLCSLIR
jgi:hypothetical protein